MNRYIIINADDFGYNEQQNSAIKELLNSGLITSTSVLAVGPEFSDAAGWLGDNGISAGVHLTINSDSRDNPWHSITGKESLGRNGALFCESSDITKNGRHKDVRAELEAQYSVMVRNGITVDHADNHCGTLYGINMRRFYIDAYDFCSEHDLPYRFPKKPDFIERQFGRKAPGIVKALQGLLVKKGTEKGVVLLDDLVSNPWNMDRIRNYDNLRNWYMSEIDRCSEGVTEFFLHPALSVSEDNGEWQKRVFEYDLLKSGDLLQRAEDKGIKVISWQTFGEMAKSGF